MRWGQRPRAPQRSAVTQFWHQAEGGTPQPPPGAPKPVATVSTQPGGPGNLGPPNTPPSSHPTPTPALLGGLGCGGPPQCTLPLQYPIPGDPWHHDSPPQNTHRPQNSTPAIMGGPGWKGPLPLHLLIPHPAPTHPSWGIPPSDNPPNTPS